MEHGFRDYLLTRYQMASGNSAHGIDFPELDIDLKVTSIKQPQSSCPYRSASQKVYGLGYSLLVFTYSKVDELDTSASTLIINHVLFIDAKRTADFQTTAALLGILERGGNHDDIVALLEERNLPLDEIGRDQLATRILRQPPVQGYLTMSNALQWRLQYGHAITQSAVLDSGVENLLV